MENHPVPQNISSYEFHLVGDMTLKQFLQLAGGILVGYMFFRLEIIAVVKYPLAGLSVLIGVLLAFIPINGRPFSSWLSAFIRAIYSPTEFVWIPQNVVDAVIPPPPIAPVTPSTPASVPITPPAPSSTPTVPSSPPKPASPGIVLPSFSDFIASKIRHPVSPPVGKETTISKVIAPPPSTPPPTAVNQPEPTQAAVKTPTAAVPPISPPPPSVPAVPTTSPVPIYTKSTSLPQTSTVASAPSAPTTSQISPPTNPNILSGLVTDDTNQPLSQITVEIIDTHTGIPARALRTNKLGQFQIAIPLPAGTYNILAEKEGLKFDPVSVQVKGNIVPPVILQGKKV